MTTSQKSVQTAVSLTSLIKSSRAIDDLTKRQWLRTARYLTPHDRARLREILETEAHRPIDEPPAT